MGLAIPGWYLVENRTVQKCARCAVRLRWVCVAIPIWGDQVSMCDPHYPWAVQASTWAGAENWASIPLDLDLLGEGYGPPIWDHGLWLDTFPPPGLEEYVWRYYPDRRFWKAPAPERKVDVWIPQDLLGTSR